VRRIRHRLASEDGIALLWSMLTLLVLSAVVVSAVQFSSASARQSGADRSRDVAYHLAEAGVNEAMAVLSKPTNNAFDANLLPPTTTTYTTGTATWSGTLSPSGIWTVTSIGDAVNPSAAGHSRRVLRASVVVKPSYTQQANNPVWNYIYTTHPPTPGVCDEYVQQSVNIATPFYVSGNLCFQNTSTMSSGPLIVKGFLQLQQPQNRIGSSSNKVNEVHVAGTCRWKNNPAHTPCGTADNVFATISDSSPPTIPPPVVYWDQWYQNASPGPMSPCTIASGTPPTFDTGDNLRNNSIPGVVNLTPAASYTCRTPAGEISWNNATKKLTLAGTIFIDGSAKIDNGAVNEYDGQSTIYASGTLLIKNSKLCATVNAARTACDTASWNPNTKLVVFVADGNGGQVPTGASIQLVSAYAQAGMFATYAIQIDTTAYSDGPLIGSSVELGQSVNTSFPSISILPSGAPGFNTAYAEPQPPSYLD
jgi:Tfp pilus assembly protein PilX